MALPIEKSQSALLQEVHLSQVAMGPLKYVATVMKNDMKKRLRQSMARARARARAEGKGGANQWYGYMERLLKAAKRPAGKGGLQRAPSRPLRKKPALRGRSLPGEAGAAESTNSPFINKKWGPDFDPQRNVGGAPDMLVGYREYSPKGNDGLDGLDELEKGATITRKSRTGWNAVGLRRFRTGSGREVTGLVLGKIQKGKSKGNLFFCTLQASPDRPESRKKRRGRPSAFKNEEFSTLQVKPSAEIKGFERKSVRIAARPSLSPTVSDSVGKGLVVRAG